MPRGLRILLIGVVAALGGLPVPAAALAGACPEADASFTGNCGPTFTLPQWGSSWNVDGSFQTIQLADVDGVAGDELIGRNGLGLWVNRWDAATGQWVQYGAVGGGVQLDLSDASGWGNPDTWETIQFADVTGGRGKELLVRGPDGVRVYGWSGATRTFQLLPGKGPFGNDDNGLVRQTYFSIQTADVDGDGKAELLGLVDLPAQKVYEWRVHHWSDGTGWTRLGAWPGIPPAVSDDQYWWYTAQPADVDGDGRPELVNIQGTTIRATRYDATRPALPDVFSVSGRLPLYQALQTGDVDGDGRAEILALPSGSGGTPLVTWHYDTAANAWTQAPPLQDLAGVGGGLWYFTIQTGDLDGDGRAELIARLADGVHVWRFTAGAWQRVGQGPVLPWKDDPWSDWSMSSTIQTGDVDGDGRAELVARGPYGIRTLAWDAATGTFTRPAPYGFTLAGADKPAYDALSSYLLNDTPGGGIRATYAQAGEGQVDNYIDRITALCQRQGEKPGRWSSCALPPTAAGGVDPASFTRVANTVYVELAALLDVSDHFGAMDDILTQQFLDQDGAMPAIDADLKLPPRPPAIAAPPVMGLIAGGLDLMTDLVDLVPAGSAVGKVIKDFPNVVKAVGITADALGVAADAAELAGGDQPTPAQSWAQIVGRVTADQDQQRQVLADQRAQVVGDQGLLLALGGMVDDGLMPVNRDAAVSAGRQAFTLWTIQAYTPAFWSRYRLLPCDYLEQYCTAAAPNNRYDQGADEADAFWSDGSSCSTNIIDEPSCTLTPPGTVADTLMFAPVTDDCRYQPSVNGSPVTQFRYGCSLGVPVGDVVDGLGGWHLPGPVVCDYTTKKFFGGPFCTDGVTAARTGSVRMTPDGRATVTLQADLPGRAPASARRRHVVRMREALVEQQGLRRPRDLARWADGAPVAGVNLARSGSGSSGGAVTHLRRRRGGVVRVTVAGTRAGHRVLVRAQGIRLEAPQACTTGRRRVTLVTRIRIGDRSGDRRRHRTETIRSTWRCVRGHSGAVTGLRLVRAP